MLEEGNFFNIRRNFIFASVVFSLFLIYSGRVEIESLLIFKLSKWDPIFSKSWDLAIIFGIFYLYTFIRYSLHSSEHLKRTTCSKIVSLNILDQILLDGCETSSVSEDGGYYLDENNRFIESIHFEDHITSDSEFNGGYISEKNDGFRKYRIDIKYEGKTPDNKVHSHLDIDIDRIQATSIGKNFIRFELTGKYDIKKKNTININIKDVNLHYRKWKNTLAVLLFNKNYSEYTWPLVIGSIPYFIGIIKLTAFLYNR